MSIRCIAWCVRSSWAGPGHQLLDTSMWATALGLLNLAPSVTKHFQQSLSRTPGVLQTYFARIIRAVQLGVHDYFQQVAVNIAESVVGVETLSFSTMLQDLKRGTFHQSTNWIAVPHEDMVGKSNDADGKYLWQQKSLYSTGRGELRKQ